ncbi:hypothetical protein V6N11_080284 [Hibiscus sabdariffa]|uniref:Uncharacterized protein n=1 Tax=Hibiscus sabdariffa TaxID=183260 RepID=A0ABR2R786_9ROSI
MSTSPSLESSAPISPPKLAHLSMSEGNLYSSPKATLTDYMGSMVAMRNTSSSPNLLRSTKPPLWRPALCKVARGSSPQQLALTSWATLIAREARERGKAKGCSSTPGVKIEKVGPSTEMP